MITKTVRALGLLLFVGAAQLAANSLVVGTQVSNPTDAGAGVKVETGRQGLRVHMRWVNEFGMDVAGGNFPINITGASVTLTIAGTPASCSVNTVTPAPNSCGFVATPFSAGGAIDTVKVFYNGNFPQNTAISVQVSGVRGNDTTAQDPSNNTISFQTGAGAARPGSSLETVFDISGSMASPAVPDGTATRMDILKLAAQAMFFLLEDHAMIGDKSGVVFFSDTANGGALQPAHDPSVITAQNGSVQSQVPTNSTSIGAGLALAASAGLGADTNPVKFVLLFSDGEQNTAPNVSFSGAGALQVGGSNYLSGVRVCPVTAGQLTGPGFMLQQTIAHSNCGDNNLHVEADTDFTTFFVQDLNDGLVGDKLEISQIVSATLNPTGTRTETFLANSHDVAVSIVLSWSGSPQYGTIRTPLKFKLTAPDGTVVDTTDDTRLGNQTSVTTLRFPLRRAGTTIDPKGLWKIDFTGGGANAQPLTYNLVVVNDNATIASDARVNVQDPGTGEPIPIRVALTEAGAPLTGATVTAELLGPANGLGDVLAKAATPSGSPSQGADPVGSPAKAKLLLLLQDPAFRALLANQTLPGVPLTESAPGIYTATFSGATKEGHYQLLIRSLGTNSANGQFQRLRRVSVYVRPKPDAANTDLTLVSSTPQPNGTVTVRITATPRDRFGSLIGPDYQPDIAINSSLGSVAVPLSDNLNGVYQVDYNLPSASSNPIITLVVMGQNVKHGPLHSLSGGGGGGGNAPGTLHWRVGIAGGVAIPHSPLSSGFNVGPSVGGDLEYLLTSVFSLRTTVGYDYFSAKLSGPGFWFINGSEYARLTFGPGPFKTFVEAGAGVYGDRFAVHFGGGAGAGLQYWFKPSFAAEGSYNFHAVAAGGATSKYSTVLLGVRFAF